MRDTLEDMPNYLVVMRERGPGYDHSKPMNQQVAWSGHANFMNRLTESGFVVLGGPLGDESHVMLVFDTEDEAEIDRRLAEDPWEPMHMNVTVSVKPWRVLLDRTEEVQPKSPSTGASVT